MIDINFFSDNKYISLPTSKNPKVYLAIANYEVKKNSYKLYNPFSLKGKSLKFISFWFSHFNVSVRKKSRFIEFLDAKFNKTFITSVYTATDKDKIIVQLQYSGNIFGYLKVGITKQGKERLKNELLAIKTLRDVNEILILAEGCFDRFPYFISKEIQGTIGYLNTGQVSNLLQKLERGVSYDFKQHPRVKQIHTSLKEQNENHLLDIFNKIKIEKPLKLVYEHGDFAPWNIFQNNNDYIMFDFEYFVKDGLEFFDLIKYYFQVENLINYSHENELIENVLSKICFDEKVDILILYLLKEVLVKKYEEKDFRKEKALIDVLGGKL